MIETVYVESGVASHERTRQVLGRLPRARVIEVERFGEVFNRKRQDFRLQKRQPALILAEKYGRKLLPAPPGYSIGHQRNFYFSHLLNCLYDCRYCFLQGMFRSAHYVLFVNWDEFAGEIETATEADESSCFFSGYDCDSLALDRLTGFADDALDLFARHPQAYLELRTKSVQFEALTARESIDNCVIAVSFTPQEFSSELEPGVPTVERRLTALAGLAHRGWSTGLRFDPLIWTPDWRRHYRDLFETVFAAIPEPSIHSISLGSFRMPRPFLRRIERLYPDDPFLAQEFAAAEDGWSFGSERDREMLDWCRGALAEYLPEQKIFECTTVETTPASAAH